MDQKVKFSDYMALMKPTIMILVVFTGATALVVHGGMNDRPLEFALLMLGIYLIGGCANALNQYFERDIDAKMERTKMKRPLASGKMKPSSALTFIIIIGLLGTAILLRFNFLTAAIGVGTVLFYSFFYTLYLKPTTPQNIVIGGAAGAVGPLIGWAAVAGDLNSIVPWVIFSVIFFWTPPHFWALALYLKDDYRRVNYPMMPIVKGDKETYRQIVIYTLITVMVSFALVIYKPKGIDVPPIDKIYIISSMILGGLFIKKALDAMRKQTIKEQKALFGYSLVYIFVLCMMIMIDAMG